MVVVRLEEVDLRLVIGERESEGLGMSLVEWMELEEGMARHGGARAITLDATTTGGCDHEVNIVQSALWRTRTLWLVISLHCPDKQLQLRGRHIPTSNCCHH